MHMVRLCEKETMRESKISTRGSAGVEPRKAKEGKRVIPTTHSLQKKRIRGEIRDRTEASVGSAGKARYILRRTRAPVGVGDRRASEIDDNAEAGPTARARLFSSTARGERPVI